MRIRSMLSAWAIVFIAVTASRAAESQPAADPLGYRYYSSGQSLWIWSPQGLLLYRQDTKVLKGIALSDSPSDSILDVSENSGALWIVSRSGLCLVDMTTATVERIPGGPSDFTGSKVAADLDFAWVAKSDTLWKFDKLGREWFAFGLGKNFRAQEALVGAFSDGTKVYVITSSNVLHFSISDEKWSAYPIKNFALSQKARYFPGSEFLSVIEGRNLYRYIMANLAWDVVRAPADIIDADFLKEEIFFLTGAGSFQYSTGTSVLRPFDIPDARNARSINLLGDTLLLAGDKNLIKYSLSALTTDNFTYPQQMAAIAPVKLMAVNGSIFLLYPECITVYHPEIKAWELSSLLRQKRGGDQLSWSDNGARLRYGEEGWESQLKGSISQLATFRLKDSLSFVDSVQDTLNPLVWHRIFDTSQVVYYTPAKPGKGLYSDLTLHNSFGKNRYADLFFRKSAGSLPEKGLFYRGDAEKDPFESAKLGTNSLTTPQSQTLPTTQFEGASGIVNGVSKLETRDRQIVRAQGGAGLKTSKTIYAVLPYNRLGEYNLRDKFDKGQMIIPGSLAISVDGQDVDTLQYSFTALNGSLTILRRDLLDPTSVIIASFKVQPVPDSGLETVEMLPKNNFGQMEYASATVSPRDWVSVEGGYTTLKADSLSQRRHIANVMVPFEFRKNAPDLLLKLTPEISYEAGAGAKAAAIGLQSRIGQWTLGKATSFFLNANTEDSSYASTDTLSRGYGRLLDNLLFKVQHDILTEVPIVYSQADRMSQHGAEHYREASAGAHFQGLPYLDLTWSQNRISVNDTTGKHPRDTSHAPDSLILDRDKSKIKVRMYEISSPAVQSLLHLSKFGYELSYTHFASHKEASVFRDPGDTAPPSLPGSGNIVFGSTTINPISSVTLTGQTTYKRNREDSVYDIAGDTVRRNSLMNTEINPSLIFQTIDAPPGIDFNAYYSADYAGNSVSDTADVFHLERGQVNIQRQFFMITKPGVWWKYLSWMSPRFGLSMNLTCKFDSLEPPVSAILFGTQGQRTGSYTRSGGLHLYPTEDITIRLEGDYTTGDSATNLHSFNDIKWWFGSNRLWQTRYEFNNIENGPYLKQGIHKMFTFFDANWNSWLRTNTQLAGSYVRKIDTLGKDSTWNADSTLWDYTPHIDSTGNLTFGPELLATFNLQQVGPIKTLLNGHTLKVNWETEGQLFKQGPFYLGNFKPGVIVTYSVSLECIFRPDISLNMYHTVSFRRGSLGNYYGYMQFKLLF